MIDLIGALFALCGASFVLIAAIGILRMPDLLIRMHAATKAGSLGVGLILVGVCIHFHEMRLMIEAIMTILFIFVTAPVASHLIARAAYFGGIQLSSRTKIDEFKEHQRQLRR